jgi:hypothetical protein
MPYIPGYRRDALAPIVTPETAGELNYAFTAIALAYIHKEGLTYQHVNDVIGALEGAKLELYRRLVVPYEDTKIQQNGDIDGYR